MNNKISTVSAFLITFLGALVILGWYLDIPALIQVHSAFTPMQFNTALGFLVTGLAIICWVQQRLRYLLILSVFLLALSILTGAQYLLGVNFGIDELFVEHSITVGTSSPGRMAPNTALGFMIVGLAGCYHVKGQATSNIKSIILQSLGLLLLSVAALAGFGYLFEIELAYGWAGLTNMAAHTSLGFILASIALISLSLQIHTQVFDGHAINITGLLFLATLLIDILSPEGLEIIVAYPSLILCALLFRPQNISFALALFAIALLTLGYYAVDRVFDPDGSALRIRVLTVFLILANAFIIEQLKKQKAQLQESKTSLELAVESSEIGLWDWDLTSNQVKLSPIWCSMLGYKPHELEHAFATWESLVHPDDLQKTLRILHQYINEEPGNHYEAQFRMRHKNGSWRIIYSRGSVVETDKFGKPLRLVGMHLDTTERANLENELALLKSAVDHSQSLVLVLSSSIENPTILYASHNAQNITGIGSSTLINESPIVFLNQQERIKNKKELAKIRRAMINHQSITSQVWLKRVDTDEVYRLKFNLYPVLSESGETLHYSLIGQDTTKLYQLEQLILEERERFQSAMVHSPIGMALVSIDARWLDVNQSVCEILGYSKAELLQTDFIQLTHPDDLELDLEQVQKMLDRKITTYEMEKRYFHKDGHIVWALLSVSLVWNTDGTPKYFISQIQDISERKLQQERLKRYTEELEQSNRDLDDFAYIASHDLKEPLRGINNHALMLKRGYQDKLDETANHKLDRMVKLSQKLEKLISDLLYFSRIGREKESIKRIPISAIIAKQIDLYQNYISEQNAQVSVANNLPTLLCNELKMSVIFRNLILNGIKYNDNTHKVVTISFDKQFTFQGKILKNVFHIQDNGIGIDPEFHHDIFRMFKRLNSEKAYGSGTGAGLAFVKKIIEQSGGEIWVESTPDKGSTFHFYIKEVDHEAR